MLAAMNPIQMYALAKLDMADDQARARHARVVSECHPVPAWRALRTRLQRHAERRRAVTTSAVPVRQPGSQA
jgi:hypothetical protein